MIEYLLFSVSAGVALISTNLDNLAVLLGLMIAMEQRRAIVGFAIAQVIVLALAIAVANGLSQSGISSWIGYLGVVPLVLGLRGVWLQITATKTQEMSSKSAAASVVVLFLSLSIDSFAVITPLLADSTAAFRLAAVLGAGIAGAVLVIIAIWGAPRAKSLGPRIARMDRIAPYIMICVGLYILLNTPTDAL
ncbi:hypothetical protein HW561_05220 [Rhodobacteraceae bacterium B1Z28]|uniref:Cadmium resistance transport/sequestration family protein n=1 Tax=Ruegeria haliotis TaxID=2747601 RepID=A0ABX2PPN6_9RHOB|nr:hypothetical protein [Ruegeria haliotis]NVO55187.1 hypothetical protein [Ruegeria haliotis]